MNLIGLAWALTPFLTLLFQSPFDSRFCGLDCYPLDSAVHPGLIAPTTQVQILGGLTLVHWGQDPNLSSKACLHLCQRRGNPTKCGNTPSRKKKY